MEHDGVLGDPLLEHLLGDVRLEPERLGLPVSRPHAAVELARKPADRVDPAGVGRAQPARAEAADPAPNAATATDCPSRRALTRFGRGRTVPV
jgi:hypothetical protein